jgi:hypothetical protein
VTQTINPKDLTVKINTSKVYDYDYLVSDYSKVDASTISQLVAGDVFTAGEFTTSGATVGTYKYPEVSGYPLSSKTEEFVIENGSGVDVTSNYAISYDITQIITEAGAIIITSSDGVMGYDGTAQSYPVYTVSYNGVELTPVSGTTYTIPGTGDELAITCTSSVTHVSEGVVTNDYTYTLENSGSYPAVIENKGTIQITPRAVTVTSADDSKTYDGTALTNHDVTVGGDGFVASDMPGISYSFTGTITQYSENAPNNNTYTVEFDETNAFASDYDITKVYGTLTITARDITFTGNSDTRVYIGVEQVVSGYSITSGSLASETMKPM